MAGAVALPSAARGPGTYTSENLYDPGMAFDNGVELWVYASESTGVPALTCSLETSADGETWFALPGSETQTIVGPGSGSANSATDAEYVRMTSTVEGDSDASITYRAFVLVPAASA